MHPPQPPSGHQPTPPQQPWGSQQGAPQQSPYQQGGYQQQGGYPQAPHQQAPYQQSPYQQAPYQQVPPQPPRKQRKAWVKALIIVGVVLAILAAAGTVIGVLAYQDYQSKFGVHEAPNADHMTAYPTGTAPFAIGHRASTDGIVVGQPINYRAVDGSSIRLTEMSVAYWDSMARGERWVVVGDLLSDTSTVLGGQYLMAFTDMTLLIQVDEMTEEETVATLEAFLAIKRGEIVEQGWGEVKPPNLADLPSLAEKSSSVPTAFDIEPTPQDGSGALLWAVEFGQIRSVSGLSLEMWQYFTHGADHDTEGPFLCQTGDSLTTCLLAGSDAMVVAYGFPGDEEELIRILNALL